MKIISKLWLVALALVASANRGPAQGTLDPDFNTGSGAEAAVQTLAVQSDGKIVAAGLFEYINGTTNSLGIARLNTNGVVDSSFNPGTSVDAGISSVAVQPDGNIILGGGFTTYQGASRNGITRINSNGSRDDTFNPGIGVDNIIISVALQPDGKVLIGGGFTSYNGTPRSGIARVNTNGTLDVTFNPGTGVDAYARSVVLQSDGKILLAGGFTTYNGVQRRGVTRINTNGLRDDTFNPGASVDDQILVVRAQPDGKVLIGGDFTTFKGISRNRIARLNANGTLDETFNPGTGADDTVFTLSLQPNGKVLVGGSFTTMDGASFNRMARLLPDGALDTNFNPGTGANDSILAMALQPDGKVVLGGQFTDFDNAPYVHLARLLLSDPAETPVITSIAPLGPDVTLAWNSIENGIYRVEVASSMTTPSWNALTNVTSTAKTASVTDNQATAAERYYRVGLLPW